MFWWFPKNLLNNTYYIKECIYLELIEYRLTGGERSTIIKIEPGILLRPNMVASA
jgi:hypothetical protein